jgi:hypothetical protein
LYAFSNLAKCEKPLKITQKKETPLAKQEQEKVKFREENAKQKI